MRALSMPLDTQLSPPMGPGSLGLDLEDEDFTDDVGMMDSSVLDLLLNPGPV